jgi:hypothetical protein
MELVLGRGEYVYSSTVGRASGTDTIKKGSAMSVDTIWCTGSGARC